MSDSDDDGPEGVAKKFLNQLKEISTNLVAKAGDDEREESKIVIEKGTDCFFFMRPILIFF